MNINLRYVEREQYEYPTIFTGYDNDNYDFEAKYQNEKLVVKYKKNTIYEITLGDLEYFTVEHMISLLTTVGYYVSIEQYKDEFGVMEDLRWDDIIEC